MRTSRSSRLRHRPSTASCGPKLMFCPLDTSYCARKKTLISARIVQRLRSCRVSQVSMSNAALIPCDSRTALGDHPAAGVLGDKADLEYRADVDGLRAVAVVSVLLF